jgi:hypothetical protein
LGINQSVKPVTENLGIDQSIKPLTEYFRFCADETVLDVGECGLDVLRFKLDEMQPSSLGHGVHGVIGNLQTSIDFFPRKIPAVTSVLLKHRNVHDPRLLYTDPE